MGERPPIAGPALLCVEAGQAAAEVAGRLVDLFEAVESLPRKLSWVHQQTERQLVADPDPALAAAAGAIAQAIDAEAGRHDRQPYHGRQHFCEVMLAASVLCQLHRLPGASCQLLLLAALIHDLGHDGKPNLDFRLERASLARAMPYLEAAGVDAMTRLRLSALVLATEPQDGVPSARRALACHTSGATAPRGDGPAELRLLEHDALLAQLALLLCEADVLPSVGLTTAHAMRMQHLLAREWGRELGLLDKLRFIDDVLDAGVIGPFFRPNVAAIRLELARRADGPR
jgi:hypothetical protein